MSTGSTQPFNPAATVSIAATTASQAVTSGIPAPPSGIGGPDTVLVYNASGSVAFVAFGNGGATAAAAGGYPVPPGASRLIAVNGNVNYAAAVLLTGTGNVFFSFGTGTVF
jgi:hypothetical protein